MSITNKGVKALLKLRSVKCVICMREELRARVGMPEIENGISVEDYAKIYERIQYEIMRSSNRRRLACGEECYIAVLEIVDEVNSNNAQRKCGNSRCKHTEKLHSSGYCSAARCKCVGFVVENELLTNPDSPELQKLIEEAKKL